MEILPFSRIMIAEAGILLAQRHQVGPPVWGISLPERVAQLHFAYSDMIGDPDATIWLAFDKGQALGFQAYSGNEFLFGFGIPQLNVGEGKPSA